MNVNKDSNLELLKMHIRFAMNTIMLVKFC